MVCECAYSKFVFGDDLIGLSDQCVQNVGAHRHRIRVLVVDIAKRISQAVNHYQPHLFNLSKLL